MTAASSAAPAYATPNSTTASSVPEATVTS
jgi:hypothetical protein